MTIDELNRIKETYIDERKRELEQGVVIVDSPHGTCGIAAWEPEHFHGPQDEIAPWVREREAAHTDARDSAVCEPMITVQYPGRSRSSTDLSTRGRPVRSLYSHVSVADTRKRNTPSAGIRKTAEARGGRMISSVSKIAYCASSTSNSAGTSMCARSLQKALDEMGYGGPESGSWRRSACSPVTRDLPSCYLPGGKVFQVLTEDRFAENLKGIPGLASAPPPPRCSTIPAPTGRSGIENLDFLCETEAR
jgi:hypothetical protein